MRDLTQHFTARADDSHAAPVREPRRAAASRRHPRGCQALVRFLAYHRIKPHAPSIPLSFTLAGILPRRCTPAFAPVASVFRPPPGAHRLLCGLPGYLNLFAPRTFAPQRQYPARRPPSPSVFFLISTDFTPTPGIPPPLPVLQPDSPRRPPRVEHGDFTAGSSGRPRALYAQ